jgi:hypothetical protein
MLRFLLFSLSYQVKEGIRNVFKRNCLKGYGCPLIPSAAVPDKTPGYGTNSTCVGVMMRFVKLHKF